MLEPRVGDFILSPNQIYEITGHYIWEEQLYYTVELLENPANILDKKEDTTDYTKISMVTLKELSQLGQLTRKEDAAKALETLFENS